MATIAAGLVIGSILFAGLDAGSHFIPQRALSRGVRLFENATGRLWPGLERSLALKSARVEVEPGINLLLDPLDLVSQEILVTGHWQPELWQSIMGNLPQGAVFFDVGAHIGYDSLKASTKVGPNGKVIAFEPNPRTLEQLRSNVLASHAVNVIIEPIACTDRESTLTLYDSTPEGNSGASSLSLANADEAGRGSLPAYEVRGRRIDDVVQELGLTRLDVMKIDVEGAEYLVLKGAQDSLRKFHPKLVVEVIPRQLANMGARIEDIVSLLNELGYGAGKPVDSMDWEWTAKK